MPYASISHKTRDSSVPNLKIYPNPDQPRKSFTEEVEAMALSLQQEGQLDPVILFEDGMLFDGECRWRASKVLEWEMLEAVLPLGPKIRRLYAVTLTSPVFIDAG
jgi:ParB family chromosome partitioning protein